MNPRINPRWNDMDDVRRHNMFTYKVAIIYVIDDDNLEVIAVKAFHSMQDPKTTKLFIEQRLDNFMAHKEGKDIANRNSD